MHYLSLLFSSITFASQIQALQFQTNNWELLKQHDYASLIADFYAHNTSHLSYDGNGLQLHSIHVWPSIEESPFANRTRGSLRTGTTSRISKRAPPAYPYSCTDAQCAPSSNSITFLSQQQQLFVSQKLCPFVASSLPAAGNAVFAMISTNMACTGNTACSAFIAITNAVVWGKYINPYVQSSLESVCDESVAAIVSDCGDAGGHNNCQSRSNEGEDPVQEDFASITVEAQSLNPPCPSGDTCATIDCNSANGNCQAVTGGGGS